MKIELNLLNDSLYEKFIKISKDSSVLQADLIRYNRKVNQCNLILTRIMENTHQFRILDDKVWSWAQDKKTELNDDEAEIFHKHGRLSSLLSLDVEDYFIHTQILMDRLAMIIASVSDKLSRKEITSFHKLTNFIKNNQLGNELFCHILDAKKWFILLINVHRNNLVVHDTISKMSGTKYSKDTFHRPNRLVFPEQDKSMQIMETFQEIKNNHLSDIPEFTTESNMWELLLVCDYNAKKLTSKEIDLVRKIHQEIGGELPEIDKVNEKIQHFLDHLLNTL